MVSTYIMALLIKYVIDTALQNGTLSPKIYINIFSLRGTSRRLFRVKSKDSLHPLLITKCLQNLR